MGNGILNNYSDNELRLLKEDFEREAIPQMNLLRNYARKLIGDNFNADDLLQDTFARAFKNFHQFEKGTNCKAWLFTIMRNLFTNEYRREKKLPIRINYDDIESFYETIKHNSLDNETAFSNLLSDELMIALNSLDDDYKTVIILCELEGLSYEEIADFVQCPIGTVRSRLHRGKEILKNKYFYNLKSKEMKKQTELTEEQKIQLDELFVDGKKEVCNKVKSPKAKQYAEKSMYTYASAFEIYAPLKLIDVYLKEKGYIGSGNKKVRSYENKPMKDKKIVPAEKKTEKAVIEDKFFAVCEEISKEELGNNTVLLSFKLKAGDKKITANILISDLLLGYIL